MKKHAKSIFTLLFILSSSLLFLQDLTPQSLDGNQGLRSFRIGFLLPDTDQGADLGWYRGLKNFLLEQDSMKESLSQNGYSGIVVLPADGYRDLLQRMDLNEFDLVFCPSLLYVQQNGDYTPVLQMRGPIYSPHGDGLTFQKGIVFAGPECTLFSGDNSEQQIRNYIATHPMAFVSSYDAAGYVYPRLELWRKYGVCEPGDYIFCGSSEEVVKYVVSGLVDIGACDADSLDTVLAAYVPGTPVDQMARILFETPPAPTSPVLMREELHPSQSDLGRLIKGSVKIYYNNSDREDIPRVADSAAENFKNLREEMKAFLNLVEGASRGDLPE